MADRPRRSTKTEAVKAEIAARVSEAKSPAQLAKALDLVACFDSGLAHLGRDHAKHLRAKLATKKRG